MMKFTQKLKQAVNSINAYATILDRSHTALYRGLADCFRLYLEAIKNPDEFTAFIKNELDITVTGQAVDPIALLVIKAAFKNLSDQKYEHRRQFGRWSIVLVHLHEAGVPVEGATTYLQNGGADNCLKLYKEAHKPKPISPSTKALAVRTVFGQTVMTEDKSCRENTQNRYVLMIAEIAADNSIQIVDIVAEGKEPVSCYLKKEAA